MGVSVPAVLDRIGEALQFRAQAPLSGVSSFIPGYGQAGSTASYASAVRAYTGNEIITAALNLLANSAAEPHIIGRRQSAGKMEPVAKHPLVDILNNPNPFTSRGQFWRQMVMDRYLAGNAYAIKARRGDGLLNGAVAELYRLRPDRVKPIPGDMTKGEEFVKAYEYIIDRDNVRTIPARDVLHFKNPNPLDPYCGISVLAPLLERVDIDRAMRRFLNTFYQRGGAGVGAMLNVKGGRMDQQQKDDLRQRFRRMFSGGQYDVLVTTAEDAQYTPFSMNRGLRDALPKEIDAVNEARIAMVFGIPGSILGLLIGYESSSYANKRQDWQVFWDLTMTPLLSDFDDVLNLSLTPEFGGIDDVAFDLSDIRALQEDVDLLHDRARKNANARIWTVEEAREVTGKGDMSEDEHFQLPDGSLIKVSELDDDQGLTAGDVQTLALNGAQIASLMSVIDAVSAKTMSPETAKAVLRVSFPTMDQVDIDALIESAASFEPETAPAPAAPALPPPSARIGRPRVEDDPAARAVHDEAVALKVSHPYLSWEQVAARVSVSDRTLREYRRRFA